MLHLGVGRQGIRQEKLFQPGTAVDLRKRLFRARQRSRPRLKVLLFSSNLRSIRS
jgi:hypothetical protein